MSLAVVIGGVRSGKSDIAESLARSSGAPVVYVATAQASDAEMAARIERHRSRRPEGWRTAETSDPLLALSSALEETVLVDGTGTWIATLMAAAGLFTQADVAAPLPADAHARTQILERVTDFARAAAARPGATIVVVDEAGLGLVPLGAGVRRYLDLAGEVAQVLAAHAALVRIVIAGVPVDLKRSGRPEIPEPLRAHGDTMVPPDAVDFAVNVAGRPQPQPLREALIASVTNASTYPDDSAAVRAIAARHDRDIFEVLPLNGGAEGFWLVAHSVDAARPVVVHPSFTEPDVALRSAGRIPEHVFRDPADFTLDPSAVPAAADLVLLGNPNNPTGTLDPVSTIQRLARPGRVVVVDEAFMDFVPGEDASVASRSDIPDVIVLRSLTKIWTIPGIRAGYALGPAELISSMRAARQPWSVSGPALAALETCLGEQDAARAIAEEIARERRRLLGELVAIDGIEVWPSAANFLLLRVPDGRHVRARLAERGIAVRRADTFPGLTSDHLRVAIRDRDDNDLLVRALREILDACDR